MSRRSGIMVALFAAAVALGVMPVSAVAAAAPSDPSPNASSPGHSPVPVFSSANGVSCPRVSYCVGVGTYNANDVIGVLTEVWNGSAWSVIPSPNPPNAATATLTAVSCTSTSHCLAVGSYSDSGYTTWPLAERWDGSSWAVVETPTPTGSTYAALSGISCTSASYCAAVGSYTARRSVPRTLVESWNGSSWSIVDSPNPTGARNSALSAVSCAGASTCMATGSDTNSVYVGVPLAELWDGSSWSIVDTPEPAGAQDGFLDGISCPSASRCLAVGVYNNSDFVSQTLAESWNGSHWSVVPSPTPSGSPDTNLLGVSCGSASSCLAVGHSYSPSRAAHDGNLVESWDGAHWSIVRGPSPSTTSTLNGVSCAGVRNCLAVGVFYNNSGDYQTLAESWNGRSLAMVNQDADLPGVSCLSATFCVAVGSYISRGSVSATLAEIWNGETWRLAPTPNPAHSKGSYLNAISCVRIDRCVAVGYSYRPDNTRVTLVESWNGVYWSIVPSPNPHGAAYSVLYGVTCSSYKCMAVGSAASYVLAEEWDGSAWSIVPTSDSSNAAYGELTGISCSSAAHCLAVGYETDTYYHADLPMTEEWDGSSWSIVPSAAPGRNALRSTLLHGMSCTPADGCLAVGESEQPSGTFATFVERWTGHRWVIVDSPSPSGSPYSELSAISCIGTGRCLAVGTSFNHAGNFVPFSEEWTGTTWRTLKNPKHPATSGISYLLGVSCAASFTCLATGTTGNPANLEPLTQRWNGSAWSASRG